MSELVTEPYSLFLGLDYGVDMSRAFEPKPGRDLITVIPLISDEVSGTLYDLSGFAAMRSFDLEEYSSVLGNIPSAASESFAKLPLEVLTLIASFLDTKSIFQLMTTSPMVFSAVMHNRPFWRCHLKDWYRWYFEWQKLLQEDTEPCVQRADLMQVAFNLSRPERSDLISDDVFGGFAIGLPSVMRYGTGWNIGTWRNAQNQRLRACSVQSTWHDIKSTDRCKIIYEECILEKVRKGVLVAHFHPQILSHMMRRIDAGNITVGRTG
ncbi:uncharacterized protein ColSpa_07317 [Colletotrichum spaethianum]|uniref:F-box domain-containing protein n=1 Tax=Colletotrichum spaethianum TaxID=700344 RepID=A0AA37P6R5_9PEZI|nr:uncharacterized protein ColSpa_07317 [Colletotrichum spaethianum]GKT47136.1 hypothetical protein ColSpa_07317 [Colletotrichum spaethianum]